jgi:4-hydroxybenzoate polyprenyltransferase
MQGIWHPNVHPARGPKSWTGRTLKTLQAEALKRRLEGKMDDSSVPLCVDIDGTVIRSNLVHELLLFLLRSRPLALLRILLLAIFNRARFKAKLSQISALDPITLPYRREVLSYLAEEQARGRTIILLSYANQRTAQAVARHLGLFADVIAVSDGRNLTPADMARLLCARFGPGQFDYVGQKSSGLGLWRTARRAVLVAPPAGLLRHHAWNSQEAVILTPKARMFSRYIDALRPARWVRNTLVFLPLLATPWAIDLRTLTAVYLAFCVFCLVGSASYIVNDLADLISDRRHPAKRRRALASGRLPIAHGLFLAVTLAVPGFAIALLLSPAFALAVLFYLALTLSYSFWLKRLLVLDIFALTSLYLSRLIAGGMAVGIAPTFWEVSFAVPFFLGFAILNRYVELEHGQIARPGRPNLPDDLPMLASFGIASGYVSVFVIALYSTTTDAALAFRTPEMLWLVCPLIMYAISKAWMLASRGEMDEDPMLFGIRSAASRRIAFAALCLVLLASQVRLSSIASYF